MTHLARVVHGETSAQERLVVKGELDRLQRQYAEITRIDYFESPEKARLAARLARLRQELLAGTRFPVEIARVGINAYRDKRWVTRPRPRVDRLACAWLIRRYVNPQAAIRYGTNGASLGRSWTFMSNQGAKRGF